MPVRALRVTKQGRAGGFAHKRGPSLSLCSAGTQQNSPVRGTVLRREEGRPNSKSTAHCVHCNLFP